MKKKVSLFITVLALVASIFTGNPKIAQAANGDLTQEQLDVLLELEEAAREYYQQKIDGGDTPELNDSKACTWKLPDLTKGNRLSSILAPHHIVNDYKIHTTLVCENKENETLAQAVYGREVDFSSDVSSVNLTQDSKWLEGELFSFFDQTTDEWKSYTIGPFGYYRENNRSSSYRSPIDEVGVDQAICISGDFDVQINEEKCTNQDIWQLSMNDVWDFLRESSELKSSSDVGAGMRPEH